MHKIILGDCLEVMAALPADSIDAVACDPPYGLSFMCRGWDHEVPGPEYWREALRVSKPGAHLVAFGGTRKYHRLGCAIEDGGWQIRDCINWLYGSGFPKSHNVALGIDKKAGHENRGRAIPTASSYQACDSDRENKLTSNPVERYEARSEAAEPWEGWGTALKPAWEPIYLARKPFPGTVADNVLKWGTGALNIDACRIGNESIQINRFDDGMKPFGNGAGHPYSTGQSQGRWPANLVLDEESAALLDEQSGERSAGGSLSGKEPSRPFKTCYGEMNGRRIWESYRDSGGASRFFYTAKASKAEKEAGLSGERQRVDDGRNKPIDNPYLRGKTERQNLHPTVKPLDLMRWLIRLISPPGATVLDPFCGSGTTVAAALVEGFSAIGIEIDPVSAAIAVKRAAFSKVQAGTATAQDAEKLAGPVQLGLLGFEKE